MMSRYTTFFRSLIKTGVMLGPIALAAIPAAPAIAGSGPQQVLYIFPGVLDNGGGAFTGTATAVHCFSFSPITETLQFIARNNFGTITANQTFNINQFQTATAETHVTLLYGADVVLNAGQLVEGVIGISATSTNIVCTAQIIDASATVPNGIDLHPTRFNPISGSQE